MAVLGCVEALARDEEASLVDFFAILDVAEGKHLCGFDEHRRSGLIGVIEDDYQKKYTDETSYL